MTPTRLIPVFLLLLFVICPMLASAQSAPGCGPAKIKFDIAITKQPPPAPTPQPGKALVYFLQDDLKYNWSPRPTTRFGIDGQWVGATHGNSYFYVFVDVGEHHLCANWQSDKTGLAWIGRKRSTAAAHLTAEAGKTYYFRAQDILYTEESNTVITIKSEPEVLLSPLDPDEAQALMSSFSLSVSHAKN